MYGSGHCLRSSLVEETPALYLLLIHILTCAQKAKLSFILKCVCMPVC